MPTVVGHALCVAASSMFRRVWTVVMQCNVQALGTMWSRLLSAILQERVEAGRVVTIHIDGGNVFSQLFCIMGSSQLTRFHTSWLPEPITC